MTLLMRIIDVTVHYPFPPDTLVRRPMYVSCVGRNKGDHYHYVHEHGLDSLALEYVVDGSIEIATNTLTYRPGPGDVYLLHPRTGFQVRDCGQKWHKLWLVAEGQLIESLLLAYGLSNVYHIPRCPVRPIFERMLETAASPELDRDATQDRLIAVFYEALIEMASIVARRGLAIPEDVLRVKNYMDNHVESQISLLELCDLVGKSKAHVIRTFKKAIGVTPYAYFLDRKIEQARILLTYSGARIREIAENLSFSDEYYFSNVFKSKTGLSPSAYRQEKRAGKTPIP
jgi:AraC-like DNA-binding protein